MGGSVSKRLRRQHINAQEQSLGLAGWQQGSASAGAGDASSSSSSSSSSSKIASSARSGAESLPAAAVPGSALECGVARLLLKSEDAVLAVDERGAWLLSNGDITARWSGATCGLHDAPSGALGSIQFLPPLPPVADSSVAAPSAGVGAVAAGAAAAWGSGGGRWVLCGLPAGHPRMRDDASGDGTAAIVDELFVQVCADAVIELGSVFRVGSSDLCCTALDRRPDKPQMRFTLMARRAVSIVVQDSFSAADAAQAGAGALVAAAAEPVEPAAVAAAAAAMRGFPGAEEEGEEQRQQHSFILGAKGGKVGRKQGCAVCVGRNGSTHLPGTNGVSAKHALVSWRDGHFFLTDLGSTNGTFERIERARAQGVASMRVLATGARAPQLGLDLFGSEVAVPPGGSAGAAAAAGAAMEHEARQLQLRPGQQLIVGPRQFFVLHHDFGASVRQGGRQVLEDSYRLVQDLRVGPPAVPTSYFAVFDGHGGNAVSVQLQAKLHKNVSLALQQSLGDVEGHKRWLRMATRKVPPALAAGGAADAAPAPAVEDDGDDDAFDTTIAKALEKAFSDTDAEILREHGKKTHDVGSTAVVSLLTAGRLYCAHVGDSRAVLSRSGVALELTTDHKPTRPDELARIKAAGGVVWQGRVLGQLAISRAFGDFTFKQTADEPGGNSNRAALITCVPEVRSLMLSSAEDEFLVLGCDGLFDVMTPQDVVSFIRKHPGYPREIQRVSEALTMHAITEKGSQDNTSAVVVLFFNPF